jgi:hypothetical protein
MARELVRKITDERKNYIINGDMNIAQRGISFAAIASGNYSLDRYVYTKNNSAVHTISQDTDVPTFAESGYLFQNSLRLNLTTPDDTVDVGDVNYIEQRIEGYNFVNLAQKEITLSFWVKATLTGTYAIAFRNSGFDKSYVAEYTIDSSDTWEKKIITIIPSPADGTWNYANGTGLRVSFILVSGSTNNTTPGSWQTGNFTGTSNIVNGVQTGATDFRITGIMLNEGESAGQFKLFGEDIQGEIEACQRYYEKSYNVDVTPGTVTAAGRWVMQKGTTSQGHEQTESFKSTKRALPTVIWYSTFTGALNTIRNGTTGADVAVSSSNGIGDRSPGQPSTGANTNDGNQLSAQWTANAEL